MLRIISDGVQLTPIYSIFRLFCANKLLLLADNQPDIVVSGSFSDRMLH